MNKSIRKLTRSVSKILQRLITDSIKHLLRCFLENMQEAEFVT